MAHFAIISLDAAGHLLSAGTVGQELVRRGHRVTVVAPENAVPLAKLLDLPLYVLESRSMPFRKSTILREPFRWLGAEVNIDLLDYIRGLAEAVLKLAPTALRELEVDGALTDLFLAASGTAAEHVGIPFVTVCPTIFWHGEPGVPPFFTGWPYAPGTVSQWRNRIAYAGWERFVQPTLNTINRQRREWGLSRFGRIDDIYSPLAQIAQMCPEFDYPRRQLPDTFHYVGSLTSDRRLGSDRDFPWDRLDGRPLIFASLGTVQDPTNVPIFPRILLACAGLDAQLILALGKCIGDDEGESVREQLGEIPANALVVDFAPQLALLDRASLLITHAGINTVMEALSRGVPMVALPRSADQPAIAARVAYSGAGLVGSFENATSSQIRDMVQRVLAEDTFRHRAGQLQTAMRAAGGLSRAADIAEEALTTRRPVKRQSVKSPDRRSSDDLPLAKTTPRLSDEYVIDAPVLDRQGVL